TTLFRSLDQMIKTSDNRIVVVGNDFNGSYTISYLSKFMEDGTRIWSQTFTGPIQNYTIGRGVVELADHSLMMAGSYLGDSDHDFNLVNYSDIGMKVFDKAWGGANADELRSITNSADGNIVV